MVIYILIVAGKRVVWGTGHINKSYIMSSEITPSWFQAVKLAVF